MIPATQPYEAKYRHENNGGRPYFTTKPVVAWSDDGTALVADQKTGRLRDADSWSNFAGITESDAPVVAALPGGTWRAEFSDDNGESISWPVLAWLVHSNDQCVPVASDRDGVVDDATTSGNFVRLFQPEEDS